MRKLSPDDIMDLQIYAGARTRMRAAILDIKGRRRVALGPHAMVVFENAETMRHQIHEMLYIEQGVNLGRAIDETAVAAQLKDELAAYNPLIPNGHELVATVMFEIENPAHRDEILNNLGGVEHRFAITVGAPGHEHIIAGTPEADTERTNAAGRASSVHFIHFPFDDEARTHFCTVGTQITLACTHDRYAHMATVGEEVRAELSGDFG